MTTLAIATFLEGRLDEIFFSPLNPHPIFMLEDLREELKNLRAFIENEMEKT